MPVWLYLFHDLSQILDTIQSLILEMPIWLYLFHDLSQILDTIQSLILEMPIWLYLLTCHWISPFSVMPIWLYLFQCQLGMDLPVFSNANLVVFVPMSMVPIFRNAHLAIFVAIWCCLICIT